MGDRDDSLRDGAADARPMDTAEAGVPQGRSAVGASVPLGLVLGQFALVASGVVLAFYVARAGLPDGGEPFGRSAIGGIAAGFSIVCFAVGGALGLSHLVRRDGDHADPAGAAMIKPLIALSLVHMVVALVAVWPVL